MALSTSLRRRFQFFSRNAGGIVGQHANTALALARAEERLHAAVDAGTARIRSEPDESADLSWMDDEDKDKLRRGYWEVRGIILETRCSACGQWQHAASLWGIVSAFDGQDTYPRVVEAELALEALPIDLRHNPALDAAMA